MVDHSPKREAASAVNQADLENVIPKRVLRHLPGKAGGRNFFKKGTNIMSVPDFERFFWLVEQTVSSWRWLPECDFGSRDAVIPSRTIIELETAYNNLPDNIEPLCPASKRAKDFCYFAAGVVDHIDNYTVPQYGDAPEDNVEGWSSEECFKQIERYLRRRNTSRRPDEKQMDVLKMAHYLQLAYEKMDVNHAEAVNS